MVFYQASLGLLAAINVYLFQYQRRRRDRVLKSGGRMGEAEKQPLDRPLELLDQPSTPTAQFVRQYTIAFLLASAAEWLQVPHLYALYKHGTLLTETQVVALYACGFVTAAVGSAFTGQLADIHGRKAACLVYCGLASLSCVSTLFWNFDILLIGRMCGGLSSTLLNSMFDTWLLTEFRSRGIESTGFPLAALYGKLAYLNCGTAIGAAFVGELLVSWTGTRTSPFLLAVMVLAAAAYFIRMEWTENYGSRDFEKPSALSWTTVATTGRRIWQDKRVFALATTSVLFEMTMHLFLFFWTSTVQDTRGADGQYSDAPLGIMFSCFMCAMLAGSLLFFLSDSTDLLGSPSYLLKVAVSAASLCLMTTILTDSESLTFFAFCMVELCIGLYFPSMNYLKSKAIGDDDRARVYSAMRLPLNLLLAIALSMAGEDGYHRRNVFLCSGGSLLAALVGLQRYIE